MSQPTPIQYETVHARDLREGDVILPFHVDTDPTLVKSVGRYRVTLKTTQPDATYSGPSEPPHILYAEVIHVDSGKPAGVYQYTDHNTLVKIEPRPKVAA